MPKGHNTGAEWWRGLVSALIVVGAIVLSFVNVGGVISAALSNWIVTNGLVQFVKYTSFLIYNFSLSSIGWITNELVDQIGKDNLKQDKVQKITRNLYQMIEANSQSIYVNWAYLKWDNVNSGILKNTIIGKLYGEANAASIWGSQSEMGLYRAMGSMNANIKYSLYN